MDVIGLLQSKKRCLRRFIEVSDRFLSEAEQADFSGLALFESSRDAVIKTLGLIDRQLTEAVRALPRELRTPALSQAVQSGLDEEAFLVQSISKTDTRIVACIEAEKLHLLRELATSRKSHEIAGRFKSTWVAEAGEGLDQKA
jgi:hypothetical protein